MFVIGVIPLDIAGGLVALATAGVARSRLAGNAVDGAAPAVDPRATALDALARDAVRLRQIVHRVSPSGVRVANDIFGTTGNGTKGLLR